MHVTTLAAPATSGVERQLQTLLKNNPSWVLLYGVHDAPLAELGQALAAKRPDLPVFGATSFQGVFTPAGFSRDVAALVGETGDDIAATPMLVNTTPARAQRAAKQACSQIESRAGRRPDALLLHATPGFEECILAGVRDCWGHEVPVYGGSAADDDLSGRWQVFAGPHRSTEGFLLVGFSGRRAPLGGFLGGYLPTEHSGVVTAASGRVIQTIDNAPAAAVYNNWTEGAIADELAHGGDVLLKTNLSPLARVVRQTHGMPRRLLSHPQAVVRGTGALKLFTDFKAGDEVRLMTSTRQPLVHRVERVVRRTRGTSPTPPQGGLLIYCAGCLGLLLDEADRIGEEFSAAVSGAPFVGIATFGEQGTFFSKSESLHGNLMCAALLF